MLHLLATWHWLKKTSNTVASLARHRGDDGLLCYKHVKVWGLLSEGADLELSFLDTASRVVELGTREAVDGFSQTTCFLGRLHLEVGV